MTGAPRRVLMLHGYSQNAEIFRKRLGALRKSMGKDIELVFVDAPIVIQPVDIFDTTSTSLEALGAAEASPNRSDSNLLARAWWKLHKNQERRGWEGLEDSLLMLRDVLKQSRFDGVFGFSQGAAMAALLSALLERPDAYPPFLIDGQPPHPSFEFCVAVAGFKVPGKLSASIFGSSYSTPTLHVLGRNDIIVIEERSKGLLDVSCNKRVEHHDGGHFVPTQAKWRTLFNEYLLNPLGDINPPCSVEVAPMAYVPNSNL